MIELLARLMVSREAWLVWSWGCDIVSLSTAVRNWQVPVFPALTRRSCPPWEDVPCDEFLLCACQIHILMMTGALVRSPLCWLGFSRITGSLVEAEYMRLLGRLTGWEAEKSKMALCTLGRVAVPSKKLEPRNKRDQGCSASPRLKAQELPEEWLGWVHIRRPKLV